MDISRRGEYLRNRDNPESVVNMTIQTIDMLKRKGVSAVAFVALGMLICAESDQIRALVVQLAGLFGGVSAAMTALSVWLSVRHDTQAEVKAVLNKYDPVPEIVTPEDEKILAKVNIKMITK